MQDNKNTNNNLNSLSDIQEALSRIQESSTFTIDMKGSDTVIGELKKISEAAYESLNPKTFLTNVQNYSFELDSLRSQMARTFGVAKEDVGEIQKTIALSYQNVIGMGGEVKNIVLIQDAITKSLNTNLIASTENVNDLFATFRATNVAPEKLIGGFREAGFSMTHIKDEMQKVVDYSRSVGVNTTEVAKKVTDNIGKLNIFNFENGVQGLAKMAAQASLLNIDMSRTFSLAEDLLSPEKAIDLSASLQRLGVTSSQLLDPLRAMDLAQNDPAELQNQLVELSQQFVRTKEDGSFEILPGAKRQMREIEGALGMSRGELSKMALQSAETAKKMSEIRFPDGLEATEEQKMLITNLSQLNRQTGKYEISLGLDESGKEIKKSIDDLPTGNKELQEILEKAQEKPTMETLAKSQLSELQKMNAEGLIIKYAGRLETAMAQGDVIARSASKAVLDMSSTLTKKLDPKSQYEKGVKETAGMRESLDRGENITIEQVLELVEGTADSYLKTTGDKINGLVDGVGKTLKSMGFEKLGDSLIKFSDKIETIVKDVTDTDLVAKLKEVFEGPLVTNITEAITNAFTILSSKDALIDIKNNTVHQFDEGDITAFVQKDKINYDNKELSQELSQEFPQDQKSDFEQVVDLMNSIREQNLDLIGNNNQNLSTIPNQEMGSFKVDNVLLKVEDKILKVEDKLLKVEDKIFHTTLKVEDIGEITVKTPESIKVEDKILPVEDKTLKVEDKTFKIDQEGLIVKLDESNLNKLSVEDKIFKVEDKTFTANLETDKLGIDDKIFKVEDKIFNVADKTFDAQLKIDDIGKLPVEDKIFKVEDKNFIAKLDTTDLGKLSVEDKTFKVEDKVLNVTDKILDAKLILDENNKLKVEDKTFKVEDKVFQVVDKMFDAKLLLDDNNKLTVEDKTFKIEDKTFKIEDKVFDAKLKLDDVGKLAVEDKTFKVEDKVFNVVDKTFDVKLEDVGKLAVEDKTFKVEDKEFFTKLDKDKLDIEDKTFKVEDKTFKVEDKVFNVVDKTFDVKLEDVGKLAVEDKIFKIEDKVFISKLEKDKLEIEDKVLKVDDTPLKVEDKKFMVELEPLTIDLKYLNPEVKTEQIINQVASTPERQVAMPDVRQETNLNRQIPTMGMVTNPEVKVSFGEMKIEISLPNLNNDPRTIEIAKNVIKGAFEDGTMKTQLSQQVVEAYNRAQNSNGVLSSNGMTNYGETKVM